MKMTMRKNKKFYTSDTHFSSERTLKFSQRPFNSVKEMDTAMIDNWNSVVKPNDDVFHLGDFGDFTIASYLNGNIYLLLGNYERDDKTNAWEKCKNITVLAYPRNNYVHWFDEIKDEDKEEFIDIELVHEPSTSDSKFFVLFGHVHEKCAMKRNGLNVGVDVHYFKPITVDKILFYKNAIENHYDDEVWCPRCGK